MTNRNVFCRLQEGLKICDVLDTVQQHPTAMEEAFIYSPSTLSAEILRTVFAINKWSTGNRHAAETRTQIFWQDFLLDLQGRYLSYLFSITVSVSWQENLCFFNASLLWCSNGFFYGANYPRQIQYTTQFIN